MCYFLDMYLLQFRFLLTFTDGKRVLVKEFIFPSQKKWVLKVYLWNFVGLLFSLFQFAYCGFIVGIFLYFDWLE